MQYSSLKHSDLHVLMRHHSFSCHPHIYQHGMSHPVFTPQPQSITALWLVLISHPAEGRRLSWSGWLGEILRWSPIPVLHGVYTRRSSRRSVARPIAATIAPCKHAISRGGQESKSPPSRKVNTLTTRLPSHQRYLLLRFYRATPC